LTVIVRPFALPVPVGPVSMLMVVSPTPVLVLTDVVTLCDSAPA
jgi:hypothetical protein